MQSIVLAGMFRMSRQFLIPWFILIQLALINGQQPQAQTFDHPDRFQGLFTHPTLAPQYPFVDGFRALQNTQMLHPHYDLLTQNSHVPNHNFIYPLHFFHLPPHPFTANNLITTTKFLSSTGKLTSTSSPVTTAQIPSITTALISTTTDAARVPQASKPLLESAKTYTPEKVEVEKEQILSLSRLETMNKTTSGAEEVKEPRGRAQSFLTPSSTILPTAQKIGNQITTNAPSSSTTLTTTEQTTTNLPKKISEETEKAALNGEKVDLIRHLNTTDLESFLKSANLSTAEAQNFLQVVEKVLEEELEKRLQKQTNQTVTTPILPVDNSNLTSSISPIKAEQTHLNAEGHEVKTVDTRLNYETAEIEQNTNSANLNSSSTRAAAYSQHSGVEINSAAKSHLNPTFNSLDEIRKREQQEFDRLLGQIVLKGDSSEEVDQNEDDDLLPSTVPSQQPQRTTFNRHMIRHPPKTNFEQLVKDYQYSLSGSSNGFSDLIKALRNAHIGLFDRTKKNKPRIRIN